MKQSVGALLSVDFSSTPSYAAHIHTHRYTHTHRSTARPCYPHRSTVRPCYPHIDNSSRNSIIDSQNFTVSHSQALPHTEPDVCMGVRTHTWLWSSVGEAFKFMRFRCRTVVRLWLPFTQRAPTQNDSSCACSFLYCQPISSRNRIVLRWFLITFNLTIG